MTTITPRLCAVLAIATAAALPGAAHATTSPPPAGRPCTFHGGNSTIPEQSSGVMFGGPLVAAGSSVSIRCSIHVGNAVHSGAAAVDESAGPSDDAVVLPPTGFTYDNDPDGDPAVICTQATVDTTTWYLTDEGWTEDANASCPLPTTITIPPEDLWPPDVPPPFDLYVDYLWCIATGGFCEGYLILDRTVCPVFASLAPGIPGVVDIDAEGDVLLDGEPFWDCPPYDLWT